MTTREEIKKDSALAALAWSSMLGMFMCAAFDIFPFKYLSELSWTISRSIKYLNPYALYDNQINTAHAVLRLVLLLVHSVLLLWLLRSRHFLIFAMPLLSFGLYFQVFIYKIFEKMPYIIREEFMYQMDFWIGLVIDLILSPACVLFLRIFSR
ncbi:hypothetical protein [Pararhodobacter sp. SW119]|uniref:hypothetical protein n=1 Tax=Pararhodobacter sp. SW119 TaxID=2780075 RepID=UPI001ADFC83C|nr:hypothetical protein [Pararhodobacter sp. SW119]